MVTRSTNHTIKNLTIVLKVEKGGAKSLGNMALADLLEEYRGTKRRALHGPVSAAFAGELVAAPLSVNGEASSGASVKNAESDEGEATSLLKGGVSTASKNDGRASTNGKVAQHEGHDDQKWRHCHWSPG